MTSESVSENRPGGKSTFRWKEALRILLALVLIGLVFSKTNLQQIRSLSHEIVWSWLATSLILYCAMTGLKAVQYWALMGRRIPYTDVLRIVVIQNGLTNLVATTAGIASYLTLFRVDQNVGLSRSGVVFLLTKVGDVFSMALFLLISAWLVWARIGLLHEIVILLVAGVFAAFFVFLLALLLRQKFMEQAERILRWLRLERVSWIQNGLSSLQSLANQDHRVVLGTLLTGMGLSFVYIVCTLGYSYARVRAFQIPIDFWAIVFITMVIQLVSMIPVQAFGGLGVIEFTSDYLYTIFGIVQVDIAAILIGMRVVFYAFNLVTLLYLPLDAIRRRMTRRPS